MISGLTLRRAAKPVVFTICLAPLAWIIWLVLSDGLSPGLNANPVETVNRYLGDWALRFLLIALSITPLVKITQWAAPVHFRRMLGLFAFAYATLHVTNYIAAEQLFNWSDIGADIVKRRFITVGMATFVILSALALTSPKAVRLKLGAKRWRMLHRGVYLAGVGAVIHFWMMVKADLTQPMLHGAVLLVLLGYRVVRFRRRAAETPRRRARAQTG